MTPSRDRPIRGRDRCFADNEEHYDFEQHRDEMKSISRRNRGFNLSQFDRVYVKHFDRSIRRLYGGKLKNLVLYFKDYFEIDHSTKITQCNVRCLLFKDDNRRHDKARDSRETNHFSSPRRRRSRSRSPRTPLLATIHGKCSVSGAWSAEGDENVQMVLWEDFSSHRVIGFMSFKGRSECTIHGNILADRDRRVRYELVKAYHDDSSKSRYLGTVNPDWNSIELVKETKSGSPKIQLFVLTHKENIPSQYYHALMQLKHQHWKE